MTGRHTVAVNLGLGGGNFCTFAKLSSDVLAVYFVPKYLTPNITSANVQQVGCIWNQLF